MDPATLGLLISIAPTVLDLLFGSGHHLEDDRRLRKKMTLAGYGMYGYGLLGFGLEGLGYRLPSLAGEPKDIITVGTFKKGKRAGMPIHRKVPRVTDRWLAAQELNRRIIRESTEKARRAKKPVWLEYVKNALDDAREQYYMDQFKAEHGVAPTADQLDAIIQEKNAQREAKKKKKPLYLQVAGAEDKQAAIGQMTTLELIKLYYGEKTIPKKIREKYNIQYVSKQGRREIIPAELIQEPAPKA
jgi:hypothetical protein